MEEVDRKLVKRDAKIMRSSSRLLSGSLIGYIKGYIPGVRENGGQYTHAAVWMTWLCCSGDSARAWELFNDQPEPALPLSRLLPTKQNHVVAADVYAVLPIPDAADGPGTAEQWAGCIFL